MGEQLTVTRALAELKVLDKRIKKHTQEAQFITIQTKSNRHVLNAEAFQSNSKAEYQSITDLVGRYNRIKSAIIQSNAKTMVKLGDETYTVADVIARRESLPMYKTLLERMREQRKTTFQTMEQSERQVETELQQFLNTMYGGSSANKSASELEATSKSFRESRKATIIDPLSIDKKIAELSDHIDNFDHQANFVLSESNAKTQITI